MSGLAIVCFLKQLTLGYTVHAASSSMFKVCRLAQNKLQFKKWKHFWPVFHNAPHCLMLIYLLSCSIILPLESANLIHLTKLASYKVLTVVLTVQLKKHFTIYRDIKRCSAVCVTHLTARKYLLARKPMTEKIIRPIGTSIHTS